ncbi:MAG: malate dehydrogenase, partial [Candidatus Paceibacterales bacterium]
VDMVDAIVHDRHRVLPTVAILQGEYGESDIAMGVPVMLGKKGLEKIIELPLNTAEKKMFDESIRYLRVDLEHLAKMA